MKTLSVTGIKHRYQIKVNLNNPVLNQNHPKAFTQADLLKLQFLALHQNQINYEFPKFRLEVVTPM